MQDNFPSTALPEETNSLATVLEMLNGHSMAWTPDDLADDQHVLDIGNQGVDEVEQALMAFKGQRQWCLYVLETVLTQYRTWH